jgi:hypothetical protein
MNVNKQMKARVPTIDLSQEAVRFVVTALLLLALSFMMILMVEVPASRAMAATPPLAQSHGLHATDTIHHVAVRTLDAQAIPARRKEFSLRMASPGRQQRLNLSDASSISRSAIRWVGPPHCLHPSLRHIV